jgi:hypothetical protein
LTSCCGLEVQKPTQALKSVKGPGNTIDLNSKWSRTLPSLIYFLWDINRDPGCQSKVLPGPLTDLSAWVVFCTSSPQQGVKYQFLYFGFFMKPTQALKSVKGPGNTIDLNSKWSRTLPSLIYFSWDIYRDPLHKKKSNIKVDI